MNLGAKGVACEMSRGRIRVGEKSLGEMSLGEMSPRHAQRPSADARPNSQPIAAIRASLSGKAGASAGPGQQQLPAWRQRMQAEASGPRSLRAHCHYAAARSYALVEAWTGPEALQAAQTCLWQAPCLSGPSSANRASLLRPHGRRRSRSPTRLSTLAISSGAKLIRSHCAKSHIYPCITA